MASSVSSLTKDKGSMFGLSVRYHWQILMGEHNCFVSRVRLFNMFNIFGA